MVEKSKPQEEEEKQGNFLSLRENRLWFAETLTQFRMPESYSKKGNFEDSWDIEVSTLNSNILRLFT